MKTINNEKAHLNQAKLEEWFMLKEKLKELAEREATLRKEIFLTAFPNAVEGTNKLELANGYQLKAIYPYTRKVDESVLNNMHDQLKEMSISEDKLVKWKPELAVTFYKTLTDEEQHLVDQFLIIKEGSPQLEITKPKR